MVKVENLQKKVRVSRNKIKKVVLSALAGLPSGKDASISIFYVNNRKIKQLNRKYLHKNNPTDVISFDIGSMFTGMVADVFISADMAVANAGKFGTSVGYELCLYAVHGVLHLFGFNDAKPAQRRKMRRKEGQIMEKYYHGNM